MRPKGRLGVGNYSRKSPPYCDFMVISDTPPKFNIAPEKWWLEDYFPMGKVTFQGRAVKLWGGKRWESSHILR